MFHGIIFKNSFTKEAISHKLSEDAHHLVLDKQRNHLIPKFFSNAWFAQEINKSAFASFIETHQSRRAIIMAWARLDNFHELISQYHLNPTITPAELILQLYFIEQEDCVKCFLGDFSFAIYDLDCQRLFCARDPMGIKPLYYCEHKLGFAFSTSMRFFHLLGTPKPRLEWVCKKLSQCVNAIPFEDTVYHQVHRCLPAHYFQFTSDAFIQRRYFTFHTEKIYLKSSEEYVEYYEAFLQKAIQRRANVSHPLGLELSGGLDSSSVTAYALQHYPHDSKDCHTFSFALDTDEPKTIFSINQRYAISSAYVCCNPTWYIDFPERACEVFAAPAHHPVGIQFEIFYQQAERLGVRTLLSGFGGDECVSGGSFQLYLYELFVNKQYQRILQDMPGNVLTRMIRGLRFLYLNRGKTGVTENAVQKAMQVRWPAASIVSPSWEHHYQLKNTYDKFSQYTQGYHSIDTFIVDYTLSPRTISARTEECTLMASTYGVEYAFPLLDVELIQCYLSIPSSEKYHQGQNRYLHRRAVSKNLPYCISSRNNKNTGLRVASHHPKAFNLNEDLHPALFEIIQKEKLWHQSQQLKNAMLQDLENPLLLQAKHNIYVVNALDHWLKYFYPNGCDWQI